jgi:hypothetical protein
MVIKITTWRKYLYVLDILDEDEYDSQYEEEEDGTQCKTDIPQNTRAHFL